MTLWTRKPTVRTLPRPWVQVLDAADPDSSPGPAPETAYAVRMFTSTGIVVGTITGTGRLSDILNRRGEVRVQDASIRHHRRTAVDGQVAREMVLDPFEIDLAMATRLPDAPWVRARRVHKVQYPVRIDAGTYEIHGIVHVFPGADPTQITHTSGALFVPLTHALVRLAGRVVSDPSVDTVLVNRHLVRRIDQRDGTDVVNAAGMLGARRGSIA